MSHVIVFEYLLRKGSISLYLSEYASFHYLFYMMNKADSKYVTRRHMCYCKCITF